MVSTTGPKAREGWKLDGAHGSEGIAANSSDCDGDSGNGDSWSIGRQVVDKGSSLAHRGELVKAAHCPAMESAA